MRKISFIAAFLLGLVSPLWAAAGRDDLLTESGTLYTVESLPFTDQDSIPGTGLRFTIHDEDGGSRSSWVPTTLDGGSHFQPSLGFDATTETLFLFWQQQPNRMSSKLLVAAYRDGAWSAAITIQDSIFSYPTKLRIAVTNYVLDQSAAGILRRRATIFHLVWWEENTHGEFAKYSLLSLVDGVLYPGQSYNLVDFLGDQAGSPLTIAPDFDRNFFRNPEIFQNPDQESVDVIFADLATNRVHEVSIRTRRENGVLRPPEGVRRRQIALPRVMSTVGENASLMVRGGTFEKRIAYHDVTGNQLRYMIYDGNTWSDLKSLTISEGLSLETGLDALEKLLISR